jgi:N-acetylglucosaminyl-diphospho-decaprenol L-rhamnosyltransferase
MNNNEKNYNCTVVIPTFFSGNIIRQNIESLPTDIDILIIDNTHDNRILENIKSYNNIKYFNIGDVGLPKTFNFALSKISTKYFLITQPDVVLRKNCLERLLLSMVKYPDAGMVAPIVFDNSLYSQNDYYDLKYDKYNKKFNYKKNKINIIPTGDICVDAINATTILIKTEVIKKIGGWDENIYVYLEDIDISLRMTLDKYSIIKIKDAVVDHKGWSSHFIEIKDTMNISRIWHFTWSSLYFQKKFSKKYKYIFSIAKIIFFSLFKIAFYSLFFNKKKIILNNVKIMACVAHIFNRGSYYRINHNI